MRRIATMVVFLAMGVCSIPVGATERFEHTRVVLERNVTDNDTEIVFKATTPEDGLTSLKVTAPDGRVVVDFKAPTSKLGIRQLTFESPEPRKAGAVQADFPAGVYTFSGRTTSGAQLGGRATLSHVFPDPTAVIYPQPNAAGIAFNGFQVKWKPIPALAACIVVIEDEASGLEIRSDLPGNATTFEVPGGVLKPGTEYKLAIGTVAKTGNTSYIETVFTTK